MQYLYCFANVSLVLRVIHRLAQYSSPRTNGLTVLYMGDRWVLRILLNNDWPYDNRQDLLAFLDENGVRHQPQPNLSAALVALDKGQSVTQVMNQYHVVIVSHGKPEIQELHVFRERFVEGLGYCPQSLA
ncbi:MAG: hypothetical protein AAFR42_19705 [Cyanobacteria bacterium J06628_6]